MNFMDILFFFLFDQTKCCQTQSNFASDVKVCGYTFRGSNSVVYIFASLLKRGLLLKGTILLLSEQILSFKSKSQFGRIMSARDANRKSQKLFLFVKMAEKHSP